MNDTANGPEHRPASDPKPDAAIDPLVWWNGELMRRSAVQIPADDAGFLSGHGVFETLRVLRGTPLFVDMHLQRLARGLETLDIAPVPPGATMRAIDALVAARAEVAASGRLRVTVTGGANRTAGRSAGEPSLLVTLDAWTALPDAVYEHGVQVDLSAWRRAPHPLQQIKSTSYGASAWLRREARSPHVFDVLQCNVRGDLAEGSFTNVFCVAADGVLRTPSPDDGCLPGVTRAVVLGLARTDDLRVEEGAVGSDRWRTAPEMFLTSSLRGLVPVGEITGEWKAASAPGPVTAALQALYRRRVEQEAMSPRGRPRGRGASG